MEIVDNECDFIGFVKDITGILNPEPDWLCSENLAQNR